MSCPLAKYSDIFGKPNEGVHAYRLLNIAVVDVVATIGASALISFAFNINFIIILICLFLLGVVCHWLFCVDTTINKSIKKLIFGDVPKK
jgi:hypothetical protein